MTSPNHWDRCPRAQTQALAILTLFAILCGLSTWGCSGADTGSRHPKPPSNTFRVRQITVIHPLDATPLEIAWIRETVEQHLLLLDAIPVATNVAIRLRVHRTLRDWQDAYQLVRNPKVANDPIIWAPPLVWNSPAGPQVFVGPVEPAFLSGATLNVIGGRFLEGPSLAHHLLSVHLPALGVHQHVYGEPLWTKLNLADWQLSQRLASQR